MAEQIKGEVLVITKNKAYAVKMDDGNFYGAGFDKDKITFDRGDVISFNVTYNGKYRNMDMDSVEVLGKAEPKKETETPQKPKSAGSGAAVSRDDYWTQKAEKDERTQKEIRLQASRNAAIQFVNTLLEKDLVTLPTKKADKVEAVEQLVDHYTHKYYEDTEAVSNDLYNFGAAVEESINSENNNNDYE